MLTDLQRNAVIAFAEADMSASRAAEVTHYHLNTIKHHLAKVKEDTGLDPKKFFDLQKLYAMAKGEDG